MSRAASISRRRISVMFSRTSGRSILGFRIEPRSPPVQVTTCTSTPCATYIAVLAAPLLDSSSGWACTCIRRRPVEGRVSGMRTMLFVGPSSPHRSLALVEDPDAARTAMLERRYGTRRPGRRLASSWSPSWSRVAGLGWLVWAAIVHANPAVDADVASFDVKSVHRVDATVAGPGARPRQRRHLPAAGQRRRTTPWSGSTGSRRRTPRPAGEDRRRATRTRTSAARSTQPGRRCTPVDG